jgi:hypothetical protein
VEHVASCGLTVFLSIMIGSGVPGSLELSSEILSSSDELLSI